MKNKFLLIAPMMLFSMVGCSLGPVEDESTSTSSSTSEAQPGFVAHDLENNDETFDLLKAELDQSHKFRAGSISSSKQITTFGEENIKVKMFKGQLVTIYPNAFTIQHTNKNIITKNDENQAGSYTATGIEEVLVDDNKVLYVSNFKEDKANVTESTKNSTNPIGLYTTAFEKSKLDEAEFKKKQGVVYNYLLTNAKSVSSKDRLEGFLNFYSENKAKVDLKIHAPFENQYQLTMSYKTAQEESKDNYIYIETVSTLKITNHNILHQEDTSKLYSDINLTHQISEQVIKYNVSFDDIPTPLKEPDIKDATAIQDSDIDKFYSLANYFSEPKQN